MNWAKEDDDKLTLLDDIYTGEDYLKIHSLNIRIGKNTRIRTGTVLRTNIKIGENVSIGRNAHIGDFVLLRNNILLANGVSIGSHTTIENESIIGENTRINGQCTISENSSIGHSSFLGVGVVNPADDRIGLSLFDKSIKYEPRPATIGSNVRIGCNVVLKPNITIEDGAVIGMGSVVCNDVHKGEVYYGEKAKLRRILRTNQMNQDNEDAFSKILSVVRYEFITPYLKGKSVIDVGSGHGLYLEYLIKQFEEVTFFESDKENFKFIKDKIPHLKGKMDTKICGINCNVEDNKNYKIKADSIICCNILEHISDTKKFLKRVKKFDKGDSVFIFTVPNSHSIHRLTLMDTGEIATPTTLTKADLSVGHKRVYDINSLFEELTLNGFEIIQLFTKISKPFSNLNMIQLNPEFLRYLINLNVKNFGAEIFCICKVNKHKI